MSQTGFEKLGIGPDLPPKLILDFCWNHEGSIARIRQMLQALKDNLTPEQYALVIPKFQAGRDLPWDRPYYRGIKKMCEEEFGLPFLCTAFDYKAVDMLDSMDVAAIKIGSAEAESAEFVEYAATKRPLLISTGGIGMDQILRLREYLWNLKPRPIFMHCVSQYPARAEDLLVQRLAMTATIWNSSNTPDYETDIFEGYSSHYPYPFDAVFAMALGAQVVEKHYSDKFWRGVDQPGAGTDFAVSIGPTEASFICQMALDWHKMRGTIKPQEVLAAERALLKPFRERFYAGIQDHHQTDHHPREDQVPGSDAGRVDSERS